MKRNFHLQRFDLASKLECYKETPELSWINYLIRIEAISKETILALEIEVAEGGTELEKKKQSWCWQTELNK
jgi:hypothetical protein